MNGKNHCPHTPKPVRARFFLNAHALASVSADWMAHAPVGEYLWIIAFHLFCVTSHTSGGMMQLMSNPARHKGDCVLLKSMAVEHKNRNIIRAKIWKATIIIAERGEREPCHARCSYQL